MLTIIVLSPSADFVRSAPGGLGYLAEMYEAAALKDHISQRQVLDAWLIRGLFHLQHRYAPRLQVHWVSPLSLSGLYLSIRHRIRKFPAVLMNDRYVRTISDERSLETAVSHYLSRPQKG